MSEDVRVVTVTAANLHEEGFFCYKSKPQSDGYLAKQAWLAERLAEGMGLHILYEGKRSVGFIEYIPAEYSWRVIDAPGALVIHCLWVVGSGKGKGYGTRLLDLCLEQARAQGKTGVTMLSSRGNWLATEKIFLKAGFAEVGQAPPAFKLLWHPLQEGAARPSLPNDWEARAAAFGEGATILYTDQCPYMPDAVQGALEAFAARGVAARAIKLETAAEARRISPTPYGVFATVLDGRLLTYHYLGNPELKRLDAALAA